MATVALGRREDDRRPARPRTGRSCAISSSSDRLSPRTPCATSRSASSRRTRWGVAYEATTPIAVVLEYGGPTPQPLFVMGQADGIAAILRDVIRPRAAYIAAPPRCCPRSRPTTGWTRARRWSGCGSTGPPSGPYPATVQRLLPVEIGDLNRLYQLGFASWLPSTRDRRGVYYGVRVNGRLVAAAGTHVVSPTARLAVVGNVLTHSTIVGAASRPP